MRLKAKVVVRPLQQQIAVDAHVLLMLTQEGSSRTQQLQASGSLPGSSRRVSAAEPQQPLPNGHQHPNKEPHSQTRPLAQGPKYQDAQPRPLANGHRSQPSADRRGGPVRDSFSSSAGAAAQAGAGDAVSTAGTSHYADQDLLTASEVRPPGRSTENSLSSSIGGEPCSCRLCTAPTCNIHIALQAGKSYVGTLEVNPANCCLHLHIL